MATDRPRRERPAAVALAALTALAATFARAVPAAVGCVLVTLAALQSQGTSAPSFGGVAQAMAVTSKQPDPAVDRGDRVDRPAQRRLRSQMVEQQIKSRGVTSPPVLAAMEEVPRHLFVPGSERGQA